MTVPPRIPTIVTVAATCMGGAVGSFYAAAPWDIYATILAATLATALVLLLAVRLQPPRRPGRHHLPRT